MILVIFIALASTLLGVGIIVGLAVMADRIDEKIKNERGYNHETE